MKPLRIEYAACETGKVKAWVLGEIEETDHLYPEHLARRETVLEVFEGHLLSQVRDILFTAGFRHLPEVWLPRVWPDLSAFSDHAPAGLTPYQRAESRCWRQGFRPTFTTNVQRIVDGSQVS